MKRNIQQNDSRCNKNSRKQAVRTSSTPASKFGTRLIPLVLKREGYADEIFYTAECAACGQPVMDFRMGNVSTVAETEADLILVGSLGDAQAFRIPSDGAFVFHKECDESGHSPWVGSHCVFRNDQRREFEKRGLA
jgi:hypothetical protein